MFKDKIRLKDMEAIIKFSAAWPVALIYKKKHPNIWLISERPGEARDNGYAFYEYIRKTHPNKNAFYVIKKDGIDEKKIDQLGNKIKFYSFKHYIYYLAAYVHISAHVDAGTPNSRVSNFLETHGLLKNKKVYLAHGIKKDDAAFGHYPITRADLMVTTTERELQYCIKKFEYPDGHLKKLGLARFDKLWDFEEKQQILLIPTWRAWLAIDKNSTFEQLQDKFLQSEYYKQYKSILSDDKLIKIIEENNIQLLFFPHPEMQKFIDNFIPVKSDNIIIADAKTYDIQEILKESKLVITDYSSVMFDAAYMKKNVCYFQFDYDQYIEKQFAKGYFSYEQDGFGPVIKIKEELIDYITDTINKNFKVDRLYLNRSEAFFDLRDNKNCERTFKEIERKFTR